MNIDSRLVAVSIEPGKTYVIEYDGHLSKTEVEALRTRLASEFPDTKFVFFIGGLRLVGVEA